MSNHKKDDEPSKKQVDFRQKRREQGLERAKAIFRLMQVHRLNLPELDIYINAKNENNLPKNPDVDTQILPNPKGRISRSRIHQILMRLPEYKAQSSWKTTRESVQS